MVQEVIDRTFPKARHRKDGSAGGTQPKTPGLMQPHSGNTSRRIFPAFHHQAGPPKCLGWHPTTPTFGPIIRDCFIDARIKNCQVNDVVLNSSLSNFTIQYPSVLTLDGLRGTSAARLCWTILKKRRRNCQKQMTKR